MLVCVAVSTLLLIDSSLGNCGSTPTLCPLALSIMRVLFRSGRDRQL